MKQLILKIVTYLWWVMLVICSVFVLAALLVAPLELFKMVLTSIVVLFCVAFFIKILEE